MTRNPCTNLSHNELHALLALITLLVLILLLMAIGIYTGNVTTMDGVPVNEHLTLSFILTYAVTTGFCSLVVWVILYTLRQQRAKPLIPSQPNTFPSPNHQDLSLIPTSNKQPHEK